MEWRRKGLNSMYIDARQGGNLPDLLEIISDLHQEHQQLMILSKWLNKLGITISDRNIFLPATLQKIDWQKAPLHTDHPKILLALSIFDACAIEEQVRLALVLANLDDLKVKEIYFSPLGLGKDPRTLELLKGQAVTFGQFETTPGFAILATKLGKHLERNQGILKNYTQSKNGLTVYLFQSDKPQAEEIIVLQFQVDDTNPEILGYLQEQAFRLHVLDYFTTPIQMKKNRPGTLITLLAETERKNVFIDLIFKETSTIGVRYHLELRAKATRHMISVHTPYGQVGVKVSTWIDSNEKTHIQNSPEYEDCRLIAQRSNIPLKKVYELALQEISIPKGTVPGNELLLID